MAELENSKDLISVLWSGADILRSKMDANEYKDYLLGIVFYKYLSDSFLIKVYDLIYDEKPENLKVALEAYKEALGDSSAEELKEQIKLFKESVDNAVKLYSAGSTESALVAEWDEIEPAFRKALKALRVSAETPEEIPRMSRKEKIVFIKMFQNFDKLFAQLKSFTQYDDSMLEEYGITQDEYEDYVAHYLNVKEEVQPKPDDPQGGDEEPTINMDYELMAYSHTKIDYEYIINLIQNIVTPSDDEEVAPEQKQKQIEEVKQYIGDLSKENPKVAALMSDLVYDIEVDEDRYKGKSIRNVIENMKHNCIEKVVSEFCITWCVSKDDVMYAATHYRNGEIPNENAIKVTADFPRYKAAQEQAIPKFKYYTMLIADLKKTLDEEVKPLLNN